MIALVSSVVPSINLVLKEFLEQKFNMKVSILNAKTHNLLVKVKERSINEVGMDIICKSAWALENNKNEILILDVGTATVLQHIKDGTLNKVAITIGLSTIYKSLNNSTDLLPLLVPQFSSQLLGENTVDAIYGGTYWGYVGLINKWIEQAQKEIGEVDIFVTGGLSKLVKDNLNFNYQYDSDIIFKGIMAIYKLNQ